MTTYKAMKKLFLIDGHSLIFRMYYAFLRRPMINTKGVDTSILYGFMKYLMELIRKEEPTHIGVAFDPPCKTFRHEIYKEYKANRSATPELIKEALDPLVALVRSLGIPTLMVDGYEADDVIGTMAVQGEKEGFDVYMVSPDKDLGQLISPHIFQYKPGKSGAENEIIDLKGICERFTICNPSQVIDILALWGDASDNVPGVRGIGEVSARKLIAKYGSIENIMEHLDELPPKQADAFREAAPHLEMSKFLVTIKTDVPIQFSEQELRINVTDSSKCQELFDHYEFPSLLKLLPKTFGIDEPVKQEAVRHIKFNDSDIRTITAECIKGGKVGIRIKDGTLYLCHGEDVAFCTDFTLARDILENSSVAKVGFDMKECYKALKRGNVELCGEILDIEIIHYLMNPERSHKFDILAKSYLNIDINNLNETPVQEQVEELDLFSSFEQSESVQSGTQNSSRGKQETALLLPLYEKVYQEFVADPTLLPLYKKIEMPLIKVLGEMELEGFKIDTAMLEKYKNELSLKLDDLQTRIRELADEPELNISSPKQLGIVLFEKLAIDPKAKKNSRNSYSTDEETLLALEDRHPIIREILDFRAIKKLISTYIEPFPELIDKKSGKIHTTFNQALTATGRLSSVKPNLQNIPIRSDLGREIRRAFIPSTPDGYIVSADYSQIELRLMAAMSKDSVFMEDFRNEKDIHTSTAARVFGTSESEVTKDQRRKAKMVNFGIIYGISPFGLSQSLRITRGEAKEIIQEYLKNYPQVLEYIESVKEQARKKGYVETLFNRKRHLPEINSRNANVRALAERNAINAPIQGSAADLIKLAMINISKRFDKEGIRSKMILQVHDELIIDTLAQERDIVVKLVKEEMENVMNIGIPLTAECNYGKNWLEAH